MTETGWPRLSKNWHIASDFSEKSESSLHKQWSLRNCEKSMEFLTCDGCEDKYSVWWIDELNDELTQYESALEGTKWLGMKRPHMGTKRLVTCWIIWHRNTTCKGKFSPHLQVKKLQTLWVFGMLTVLGYLVLVMMEKLMLLVDS